MTPITLVMAYYENPVMLREQLTRLWVLPAGLREHLHLVIVDDGSPQFPAVLHPNHGLASARLFRMDLDVRWNQDACRNVGVHEAQTEWVLLTDMDHIVPEVTWHYLLARRHDPEKVYMFGRRSLPRMDPYRPHPNTWFMTRAMYDRIGGYDERFAGWYSTDSEFRSRVRAQAEVVQYKLDIIRVPREVVADASTTTYERKTEADRINISRIWHERDREPGWKPKRLSFPYRRAQ